MRAFPQILRRESPITLAREVLWRTQRSQRKKKLSRDLVKDLYPIDYRAVPYYSRSTPDLSPEARAAILGYADEVCAGRFPFLGYGSQNLGLRPRWNEDFVCGMDWPHIPLENRDCMRFDGSDVKAPYELSRLQFLPVLGKAHVLTGSERYRETARQLLDCWIEDNPAGVGVNWSLAMEAALRGMSICFFLALLQPFKPHETAWVKHVARSLWQHLLYVEANLEFSHLIRSNHYLSNILGLYCLSLFLEGEGMTVRRQQYRRRVEREIRYQVYPDGGDFEASTGYHVLVTQMFTTALLLMRASGATPAPELLEKLKMMYAFMNGLASSSGQLPHFGDCDDGRVELLGDDLQQVLSTPVAKRNSMCVSNLLGIGVSLFGEGRGVLDDAKWHGLPAVEGAPMVSSKPSYTVFPQSGVGIAALAGVEALFFAVPNGIHGKGSHTHNDKLSLVVRIGGKEALCDSGTCCYTRDVSLRNKFRSTDAHNTVRVDGREQNAILPGRRNVFRVGPEAVVTPVAAHEENGVISLSASHLGYRSIGVVHARTVRLISTARDFAVVEDHLQGGGKHVFDVNFQLSSEHRVAHFEQLEAGVRAYIAGGPDFEMTFRCGVPGEIRAEALDSLVSTTFGSNFPGQRIQFSGEIELPARLFTTLSWPGLSGESGTLSSK